MSRVIQNSDDEGDLSDASPIRPVNDDEAPIDPPVQSEGLAPPPATSINGTSSSGWIAFSKQWQARVADGLRTEKLRREMQQAHNAMFDPSPSAGTKRPRAADDAHPATGHNSSSPVKRTKTSAPSTTQSPNDLSPGSNKKKLRRAKTYAKRQSADFATFNEGQEPKDIWDVPHDQPVKHVKSARLERLSAGVPFVEVFKANEAQTVAPMDTLHSKTFQPSPLDSSAFISPTNASDPFTQTFNSPSMQLPHMMGEGFESHEPNVMFPELSSTIPATSSDSEKRLASSAASLPTGDKDGMLGDRDTSLNSKNTADSLDEAKKHDEQSHEPPSLPSQADVSAQKQKGSAGTSNGKLKKRKAQLESEDNPPHSDGLIGLPKEMYKPRPSRSRSAHLPENDAPPSSESAPGRLKKPRRSKTVGGMSMETTQFLVNMGFSPSQAENALIETDWVLEKAADLLLARAKSKSRSPELVRSKAMPPQEDVPIGQPQLGEVAVVIQAEISPITNETTQVTRASSSIEPAAEQSAEVAPAAEVEEDWQDVLARKASDSARRYKEQQAKQASQNAAATETAQSPSSNTKVKRTKSTKSRGKAKKSEEVVDGEEQEDELSAPAKDLPTVNAEDKVEEKVEEIATAKSEAKEEKLPQIKLKLPSQLSQARNTQADTIELDDDDDSDGPPTASKIRRLKTAPPAALKKEKKKRGRPKKADKVAAETKNAEGDAHEAREKSYEQLWESQIEKNEEREALQVLDKNASSASQAEKVVLEEEHSAEKATKEITKPKRTKTKSKQPQAELPNDEAAQKEMSDVQPAKDDKSAEPDKTETPEKSVSTSNEGNITEKLQKAAEAKAAEKKKPGTHSPIKKHAMSYRVGLSKHSRIEPLLKIKARPRTEAPVRKEKTTKGKD